MDHTENSNLILSYIAQPAFLVKDGIVTEINQAAQNRAITVGTPISDLLVTGKDEYSVFSGGVLYLTVQIFDLRCDATVSELEGNHLFVLEPDAETPELRALSLAAMQLRMPMSGLMLSLEKLNASADSDNARFSEQLSHMNRSLHQMLRMISNMSDTARYAASKVSRLEVRDAKAVFSELFQKVGALTDGVGVHILFTALNESVYCLLDTEKLERAVYNLISNAMKFTPKGGNICVKAENSGSSITLTVENDTAGNPNLLRSDLFRRYTREPSLEDARSGIGLGMALVRMAAAVHDGTVLVTQTDSSACVCLRITVKKPSGTRLSSATIPVDYTGERDHGLVELSDVLPSKLF